jgi:predicted PurR-regulated permease PerM
MPSISNQSTSLSFRFFVGLAGIGLSIAFIHSYAEFFNALALAVIISMTVSPLIYWLRRHGTPAGIASLIGLVVTLSATIAIAWFVMVAMARLVQVLPQYAAPLTSLATSVMEQLAALGIEVEDVTGSISAQQVVRVVAQILGGIVDSISFVGLMLLMMLFMPAEALIMPAKVDRQLQTGNRQFARIYHFSEDIRRYVSITTLLGLGGGFVIGAILWYLGVPFAALWGFVFFVMSYIPVLGFWIALLPPLVISLGELGAGVALIVLLVYMIISFVIQQVLRPSMMKDSLDLSPLWSLLSLIFWGMVLGAPGMIIGVPLTIAIKELVLENDPGSQWVSAMMSASAEPKADAEAEMEMAAPPAEDEGS